MTQMHPVVLSLAISFLINMIFFVFAALFKTDKVTDISYSLSFFILAPLLFGISGRLIIGIRALVALGIMIWAGRLGTYLLRRIMVMGKDERFDDKRDHFLEFLRFWILQTLVVWIIMLPFSLYLTSPVVKSGLISSLAGFFLFITGLIIETISDSQKFRYRTDPSHKGHWVDIGLWKYSRHPNYFGEILLWWGLFIVVSPHLSSLQWLTVISPLTITLFLLFVSGIPLLEKNGEKKYGSHPLYKRYREKTSLLVPWPARRDF